MSGENESVTYRVEDHVAVITLNRPEQRNALNFDAYDRLERAFRQAVRDPDARCVIVTGGEFGILGNYAQFFLSGKGDLTLAIPTVSELASILVDPLLRDVVGGVGCARGEVGKERLIGGESFLLTNPSDRSIGQILGQVIAFLRSFRRFDRGCSLVQLLVPPELFRNKKVFAPVPHNYPRITI